MQTKQGFFYANLWKTSLVVVQAYAWINVYSHPPSSLYQIVCQSLEEVFTTSCASFSLIYVNICWCFLEQVLISRIANVEIFWGSELNLGIFGLKIIDGNEARRFCKLLTMIRLRNFLFWYLIVNKVFIC